MREVEKWKWKNVEIERKEILKMKINVQQNNILNMKILPEGSKHL